MPVRITLDAAGSEASSAGSMDEMVSEANHVPAKVNASARAVNRDACMISGNSVCAAASVPRKATKRSSMTAAATRFGSNSVRARRGIVFRIAKAAAFWASQPIAINMNPPASARQGPVGSLPPAVSHRQNTTGDVTTSSAAPKIWPTRAARRPVADSIIVSISRSGTGLDSCVRSSSTRTSNDRTWRSSIGATKGATSADVFGKTSVAPPDVDLLAALALSATTTPKMLRATAITELCRRSHWGAALILAPRINRGRCPPPAALYVTCEGSPLSGNAETGP